MSEINHEVIAHLNDLVETCKDEEKGFRDAASRVGKDGDAELRTLLNLFAQQRTEFGAELKNEVLRRGGEPAESGHVSAAFRRGWADLKSALGSGPDYSDGGDYEFQILVNCEAGEKAAMENYEHVMKQRLPADLQEIVENQYVEIRRGREQMRLLSTQYKPAA